MRFNIKLSLKYKIIISYLFIFLLIGCVVYTWYDEKQKLISFETVNKEINDTRQQIHSVIVQIAELSLLGENILEWGNEDVELYHSHRMVVDSMLCSLKRVYPAERIDSVCFLLENKISRCNSLKIKQIERLKKMQVTIWIWKFCFGLHCFA